MWVSGYFRLVSIMYQAYCVPLLMKTEQLLRAILPDVLIDNFDVVSFEKTDQRFVRVGHFVG